MLLEPRHPTGGRRIAVLTRNATVTLLLRSILEGWHYPVVDAAADCDLLLIERGLSVPVDVAHRVWLTPMPLAGEDCLEVPLSLVDLYFHLERRFFPAPRRHIRISLDQPVDLNVRGVWLVGRLLSLSERGARVSCPALLPRQEPVRLDFKLGGYPLRLTGESLYDIPAGDSSGREYPQAGLLFRSVRPALRQALRRFIERSHVERACAQVGVHPGNPSLSWFTLSENPWADLGG